MLKTYSILQYTTNNKVQSNTHSNLSLNAPVNSPELKSNTLLKAPQITKFTLIYPPNTSNLLVEISHLHNLLQSTL